MGVAAFPGSIAALVLVAVVLWTHFPVLDNGFINWDDPLMILDNPLLRDGSWTGIGRLFTTFRLNQYTPLSLLSYLIEYQTFGPDPFWFHAVSLVLHLAVVLLVWRAARLLTGSPLAALVAGLWFGVHPIQVATVAWANERRNLLYAGFSLASLLAWEHHARSDDRRWWWASLAGFVLAGLSKGLAFTLPGWLLLLDWRRRGQITRKDLTGKWPFFLGSLALMAVGLAAAGPGLRAVSWLDRIRVPVAGFWWYLATFLWPDRLAAIYPLPTWVSGPLTWHLPMGLLGLAGLAWVLWRCRSWGSGPLFGVGFFVLGLAPVSGILPLGADILASDHFVYLPSFGLFLLAGEGVATVWHRFGPGVAWRGLVAALLIALTVFWSLTARAEVRHWNDSETLFGRNVTLYPDALTAWYQLGWACLRAGKPAEAEACFGTIIRHDAEIARAYASRAQARVALQHLPEAAADLDRAVALDPAADFLFTRARVRETMGLTMEAVADLDAALTQEPSNVAFLTHRAGLSLAIGRWDAARADLDRALTLRPRAFSPRWRRAGMRILLGNIDGAVEDLDQARSSDPEMCQNTLVRVLLPWIWDPPSAQARFLLALESTIRHHPWGFPTRILTRGS